MKFHVLIFTLCLLFPTLLWAQTDPAMTPQKKYIDSIKHSAYPYIFPAWGKKVVKRGIELPLSAGIMINYITGSQDMTITDLQVGFNGNPLVPLDFIEFGSVKARFQSVSARIDLWPLPFFNVYGLVGETFAKTAIQVTAPFQFSSSASFQGPTAGVGATAGGRLHGIFFVADYNNTWSFLKQIEGAIHTQSCSIRAGHLIPFKNHPKRNILLWVGASGIFINRTTVGTINFDDLNTDSKKVDLDKIKAETADWYQKLKPAQQVVVRQIAEKLSDKIDGLDPENASISYSLNKHATSNWSMLGGGQFQLNPKWQFRAETGFLGGRTSLLASVNFRFGL